MKSFGLLRTNVGLTTNIKIMVDSSYNLSLDSIDSKSELSANTLKKVTFNKKNYWDELIKYFFNGIPADTAYHIKQDGDEDNMWSDFSNQYDEIYQYGARNISNNKNYKEEFEYFAPLYINKGNLPKYFIIFRIDGPGVITSNRGNFKSEILQKLKTVKIFDFSKKTNLGEWLENNFSSNNQFFPNAPLEMDFRSLEFCRWNGINFDSGGYVSNSLFIDDILDEEKEIFGLEKFIFDKFKELKVVCANILNFSFLFDDEPSTPEFKRKWSINRYLGFYLEDIELVTTLSPYITPFLHPDTVILSNNILYSPTKEVPFIEGWSDTRPFYIEYLGNYYRVEKITEDTGRKLVRTPSRDSNRRNTSIKYAVEEFAETQVTRYKIISDLDLKEKQSLINKNFGYINTSSILEDYNNNPLIIDGFDDCDVWLIEVDGIYHNLSKTRRSSIQVVSDYSFQYDINSYSYTVAGETKKVSTMVDFDNPPKKWSIYRLKFSDIKDFDDRIVDTEFSKFEYEKVNELTNTDEPKLYFENLNSGTNPPVLDDFIYKGQVENIPVSSEYTANQETFKIEEDTLTRLWRKNSLHCRWVFKNSISANDYPYLLNNSAILDDYNRTTNTYESSPKRSERNLDYFYTINLQNTSYLNHSLHVCSYTGSSVDNTFTFDLKKYLNLATYSIGTSSATYSFDYFSSFFDRKDFFADFKVVKNSSKYSIINSGDKSIPNITLFKGIKFLIYDVDSIKLSETGDIDLNLKNSNTFEDYKFSVLLSDNDWSVNDNGQVVQSTNLMNWAIIDEWKMDTTYPVGTIGIFDDILYISQMETRTEFPIVSRNNRDIKSAPHNLRSNTNTVEWEIYNHTYSIFWNPERVYDSSDLNPDFWYKYIAYNSGEYYKYNNSGTDDFWNPQISESGGYDLGEVVLYKNQYYMSMTSSNSYAPDFEQAIRVSQSWNKLWVATQSTNPKWSEIQLWNPSVKYILNSIVVHNDIVWIWNNINGQSPVVGIEPQNSSWTRLYSIEPDTNFNYQNNNNPIIRMNNKYYMINSNELNSTLDNGIIIYINKKWKNILVNINVADNTTQYINGVERDYLYTDLNRKFTANNFILSINDIRNKYDFTDYVTYVIVDESGNITKHRYNLNLTTLKHMIVCETAEDLDIKVDSLKVTPIQMTGDLRALKTLENGNIKDITYLNYYNNTAIACRIEENKFQPKVFDNYHGNKNITKSRIYRFSGEYTPLFYDLELFEKSWEKRNTGNYRFDTSLSNFGIMRERRVSKINRKGSKLKLKDSGEDRPIYPMLDEFGYTTTDFYIFSSTWDLGYHLETSPNENIVKDVREFVPSEVKNSSIALSEIFIDEKQIKLVEEIGQPPINNTSKNQDSEDSQL